MDHGPGFGGRAGGMKFPCADEALAAHALLPSFPPSRFPNLNFDNTM